MSVIVSRGFSHIEPRKFAVFDIFTLLKKTSTYIPSKRNKVTITWRIMKLFSLKNIKIRAK